MPDLFVEFARGSKGMDAVSEPSELDAGYSTLLENLTFIKRTLRTRFPVVTVAPPQGSSAVRAAFQFQTSDSRSFLVRVTASNVQVLSQSNTWQTVSGVVLTSDTRSISFAGWNDNLMISNGLDYVYYIDLTALTGEAVTAAPIGHQLTVWAGRVFVVRSDRVTWSVRNNNLDWTGVGSGYEDLRSVPEGIIGEMYGLFPVTDETALLVRSDSIWQVTQTGIVDAPFRFNRLHANMAAISPYAVASIPDGIIGLFDDGVHIVTLSGVTPVGETVARTIVDDAVLWRQIRCAFDRVYRRVAFLVPTASGTSVWMLHLNGLQWTKYTFSFNPTYIAPVEYTVGQLRFDDLTGTFDGLTGSFDGLGRTNRYYGFVLIDDSWVYREYSVGTSDYSGASQVTTECTFISPNIDHEDHSDRARLQSINLLYRASQTATITWYVSSDGGNTWTAHSTTTLEVTTGNQFASMRKPYSAPQIMIKGVVNTLADVKFLSIRARIQNGALRPSS